MADCENIYFAVLLYACSDESLYVILRLRISCEISAVDAFCSELVNKCLKFLCITSGHENLSACISICLCQNAAKCAGSSGNESNFALYRKHVINKASFNVDHSLFPPLISQDS